MERDINHITVEGLKEVRMPISKDDILSVQEGLIAQTRDEVAGTLESILKCFKRHCSCSGYGQYIWDDGFVGAFESAQKLLIEAGLINPNNCMRTK